MSPWTVLNKNGPSASETAPHTSDCVDALGPAGLCGAGGQSVRKDRENVTAEVSVEGAAAQGANTSLLVQNVPSARRNTGGQFALIRRDDSPNYCIKRHLARIKVTTQTRHTLCTPS